VETNVTNVAGENKRIVLQLIYPAIKRFLKGIYEPGGGAVKDRWKCHHQLSCQRRTENPRRVDGHLVTGKKESEST